ncbi:MAG: ACT domain-containing protein, partial [Myxococcota bacterium]
LGRFQGQLADGAISQVEIQYAGDIAGINVAPLTIAVLKGLLEHSQANVNMVNAPLVAQELGIKLIETRARKAVDFASSIMVKTYGRTDRLIEGAIFHGSQPRIVRLDDFMLEAIPEGPTLLLHNHDQAGVVGTVGSILGDAGINISRMQLALVPERSEAAMLVNVDPLPPESVMEEIRSVPHVITVKLLEL